MRKLVIAILAIMIAACSPKAPSTYGTTDSVPTIFPDYTNVTIPGNIAPMNFLIEEKADAFFTIIKSATAEVSVKGNEIRIPTSVVLFEESTFAITKKVFASIGKQGEQNYYCNESHFVLCFLLSHRLDFL